MRWKSGRRSSNIEDRRGLRISRRKVGGGIGTIVLVLVGLYFGIDPSELFNLSTGGNGSQVHMQTAARSADENQLAEFVSVVLADTEDTWHALFAQHGKTYEEPVLVLFSGLVQSACGMAQAAMGPFYCPADQKLYIDLDFYEDLKQRHGAPGDFAQAYVIAHEVGHHVQKLLGISDEVQARRRRLGEAEANQLSVRLELQADCLAGLWGYHADRTRQLLEDGDIEEALQAASSIGDDRLQRQSRGYAVPESFTHGSSEQRVRWFKRGISSGSLEDCNTFKSAGL